MSTAIQPANIGARRDIRDFFMSPVVADQVKLALPKFMTPERLLRIFMTQINGNQKLQECTRDSLLNALMRAAQMGIEPDGRNGHLIPRWNSKLNTNECTFQPDYKGLIALVRRNDDVEDVYAELVHEADNFKITKGLNRDLVHEIDIRKDRGAILGAYAVIRYKGGYCSFDFMSSSEIHNIRDRSDGWRAFKAGKISSTPWGTDEGEMSKKTVLKRLLKLADLNPDTQERLTVDVESESTRMEHPQFEQHPQAALNPAERVALPAGEEQPSNMTASGVAAAAEPAKPAKAARTKLPTRPAPAEPKKEEPPAPQETPAADTGAETSAQTLLKRLSADGFTVAELITLAIENNWCEPCDPQKATLESLGDEKLEAFLGDFETVHDEILAMRERKAAK